MPTITQHPLYICPDCNAQADTPKECCGTPMVESPDKFITRSTATPEDIVEAEKVRAEQLLAKEAQAIKRDNEAILKQIGEQVAIKNGKAEVGLDTTEETTKISELKLQLK